MRTGAMSKPFKCFECNSPCKIGRKIFDTGERVFLLNEFPDTAFGYINVELVAVLTLPEWHGVTSKSYFEKHFNFVSITDEPNLTNNTINQKKGNEYE